MASQASYCQFCSIRIVKTAVPGKITAIGISIVHNEEGFFSAICQSCFAKYAIRRQNQQTLPPENRYAESDFCYFFISCSDAGVVS